MMQPRRSILDVLPITRQVRKQPIAKDHWLMQASTNWQEDGEDHARRRRGNALAVRANKVGFSVDMPSGWKKSLSFVGEDGQETR
eukprot:344655-Amphidinium_carterae.1